MSELSDSLIVEIKIYVSLWLRIEFLSSIWMENALQYLVSFHVLCAQSKSKQNYSKRRAADHLLNVFCFVFVFLFSIHIHISISNFFLRFSFSVLSLNKNDHKYVKMVISMAANLTKWTTLCFNWIANPTNNTIIIYLH